MAPRTPRSSVTDGSLMLVDGNPRVTHADSQESDRFTVTFTLKGTDLLALENVLAPRLARIGVERITRVGMKISLDGVRQGREAEVLDTVQAAIDDVNDARAAARAQAREVRAAAAAAAVVSEDRLEAVRSGFRAARERVVAREGSSSSARSEA